MKTNILFLFLILSIPFALSSQTRKAIPSGRYEALSGIKTSRTIKNPDQGSSFKDGNKIVWAEVEKIFPTEQGEVLYANLGSIELGIKSNNFHEAKSMEQGIDLLITSDLQRDKDLIKYLKGKKIVALFDSKTLEKIIPSLKNYEVISFRADKQSNFYLLRAK